MNATRDDAVLITGGMDFTLDGDPPQARYHVHCELRDEDAVEIWVDCTWCDDQVIRLRDATDPTDHWAAATTLKAMQDHRLHCEPVTAP